MTDQPKARRLLWASNAPWNGTGYGIETRLFTSRLKEAGYDIAICATWGLDGGIVNWGGIPVFPKGLMPYAQDVAPAHAKNFNAKYLITLLDAWVFNVPAWWQGLQSEQVFWIPWFPVDTEPLPNQVRVAIERAHRRLVYSRYAEKQVNQAGLDCTYIPHGVDTNVFVPTDMLAARRNLITNAKLNIPEDCYLVGMVAANKGSAPSRKAFVPQLQAFAEFRKRHSDAVLYLHATPGDLGEYAGVNLPEVIQAVGLTVGLDVFFADRYALFMGYPDLFMRDLYNAMDVHMLVSMGEGFGIPLVEAQACGTPVITGEWTASGELCFSGWKLHKSDAERFWNPIGAWMFEPKVAPILDALEQAYRMRGNTDYRNRARDGAVQYDADKVTEKYWLPFLDELFTDLEGADAEIAAMKVEA